MDSAQFLSFQPPGQQERIPQLKGSIKNSSMWSRSKPAGGGPVAAPSWERASDGLVSADVEALGRMVPQWLAGEVGSSGLEGCFDHSALQWLWWPEVVHHMDPLIIL